MNVLIGECAQEVSTFNPCQSGLDDFVFHASDGLVEYHRFKSTEIGGALTIFEADNIEPIGAFSAKAITSGGILAGADWSEIAAHFLDAVKNAPEVDGIYFSMHGAMCATGVCDPEGFLLEETRRIVGETMPIVVSLDLHGIMTDRMLRNADVVVGYHTYPHKDFAETGARAAQALIRLMRGEISPITAMVRIPALVRGDELITETGLIGNLVRDCQSIEADPVGISASMFWGNPFTDVPDLCSNSLIVLDGDERRAREYAVNLARRFWADRSRMQAPLVSIEEAILQATGISQGTVVFVDAADATSSGASGDSNAILRGLLEAGYQEKTLIPIVDALAVEAAMAAGIGATIDVTIGGTLDPARFDPLPVRALVRHLSDGRFINESHGTEWFAGNSAVLEVGNITLVVTSRAVSLYDRSLFYALGQNPRDFDLVVQKSPHCRHEYFADWAVALIGVDAPGSTSANLPYLGHTVCHRPMYPMESDTTFEPEVLVFNRRGGSIEPNPGKC